MDRTIEIAWDGEQVKIKPTMELAHDIEGIVNVPKYIMNLDSGFRLTESVKIMTTVLNFGGVKVTEDQVYEELATVAFSELVPLLMEILQKVFPMFFNVKATKKKRPRKPK